jgi:hypothetical protein
MLIGDLLELLNLSCHKLMLRLSQGVPPHVIFFCYLDVEAMGFADPVFPVPSLEVHTHASPELRDETWSFNFGASLEPDANDYWRKFQCAKTDVGRHILKALRAQRPTATPLLALGANQELPPGSIWVSAR